MDLRQRHFQRSVGALWASTFLIALLAACQKSNDRPSSSTTANTEATTASNTGEPSVTPPVVAGADDLFEDVTAKAGIKFVHQFCDTRIANIIESNGAGAVI